MYGWAGQQIRVNLTEGEIVKEETPENLRLEYLGGRGFQSKALFDEVRPGTDPLGPENILLVGASPLVGTLAPAMARWTVSAKSPLTGLIGNGSGSGTFAAQLKYAGYDQIIFHGQSPRPVYLFIDDDRIELRDASHLWGKTTWETQDSIIEELHRDDIGVLCIGPAGENLVRIAKLISDKVSAGGKCGMGAVMGSKNLKAVVARGTKPVNIARPEEFYKAAREAHERVIAAPYCMMLSKEGTIYLPLQEAMKGSATTRNSQAGGLEGWEKLTSDAFEAQYAVRHMACFGCPIACKHCYEVKDGPFATRGGANEYGTLYPFTTKVGSDNLAASLFLTTMCDQLGIDTHSCGGTISFAMEAWERGLLNSEDTDGLDLSWGNTDTMVQLVRKIAYREGFGNILAEGSKGASRQIKGSEVCLVETKGLECSNFFPGEKESKIVALAFATTPIGGSFHRGGYLMLGNHPRIVKALGAEYAKRLGYIGYVKGVGFTGGTDSTAYEGQGLLLALENDMLAVIDSLESCTFLFVEGAFDEHLFARLFSAATGYDMDGDTLIKAGERIFNIEKAFNVREGMRRKDDTLPRRFFGEKTTPRGVIGINEAKFKALIDEYYQARGWDMEGIPTRKKLEELNLGYVAEQIPAA
ncbi:MAG: aldehyde ferredoxin oxidoreductase family protein [Chloroflexi bacterium]|nr:aldehyde ferredoxin oxidoreductase family protein [Chloroflexota bacterium]